MSTDVPVHQYTCSVYFFFFGITCAVTFQLVYWGTYTQIHPKINLPLYPHASFSSFTTKTYLSPLLLVYLQIYMYPFMTLPVYFQTFILITIKWWLPVSVFTVLHVHRCTCSSLCLFSLFVPFRHNIHNYLSTHILSTGVRTHVYLFIFRLLFCLSTKTYLSPQLPVYIPIDLPIHYPTCSFWLFHSDKPFVLTCPLTYCSKYSQIYHFINQLFNLCVFFTWLYMHTYLSTPLLVGTTDPPENECTSWFWCFWL